MKTNIWTYLAALLLGFGAVGAVNKYFISGEHAFGITPNVPWGALIAAYVFFAVSATGTGLVASLGHVFKVKRFEVFSKRALVVSILLLTCAFGVLAIELSNPFKMVWLLFTPNLSSAIFWMGACYGVYLILLFAELFFSIKNNHKAATSIAYVSFVVKLAALINLGRLFGFSETREFWFGYYYPTYMVVTAIVSGAAVLTIVSYFLDWKHTNADLQKQDLIGVLGKILAGSLILFTILQTYKIGSAFTSNNDALIGAAKAIVVGPIAPSFWIIEVLIGVLLPIYILFSSKFTTMGKTFIAALFTMLGLLFSRFGFVYSGLAYPLDVVPKGCTPLDAFHLYSPTWSEWSLILGAIGFIYIAYSLADQKIKLDSNH